MHFQLSRCDARVYNCFPCMRRSQGGGKKWVVECNFALLWGYIAQPYFKHQRIVYREQESFDHLEGFWDIISPTLEVQVLDDQGLYRPASKQGMGWGSGLGYGYGRIYLPMPPKDLGGCVRIIRANLPHSSPATHSPIHKAASTFVD